MGVVPLKLEAIVHEQRMQIQKIEATVYELRRREGNSTIGTSSGRAGSDSGQHGS